MEPEQGLEYHFADHFPSLEAQHYAARLGMWLFLATEILLFAGLFVAYTVYRFLYPVTFQLGSRHLSVVAGTINTIILITSSLTVALSLHYVKQGRNRIAALCLFVSILFALAFLGVKSTEYYAHWKEGGLPGRFYHLEDMQGPGASMFFTLYFFTTGLHAIHVIIGSSILAWLCWRTWRGEFSLKYSMPVELGGLYWHLVDLVWIFLFPLLYLI